MNLSCCGDITYEALSSTNQLLCFIGQRSACSLQPTNHVLQLNHRVVNYLKYDQTKNFIHYNDCR